jgi:hypothetical protein
MTRVSFCLWVCLAICGCSTHRTRCDQSLQPINPLPAAPPAAAEHTRAQGEVQP